MKKALFTTFIVMLAITAGYCGGSSVQKWNYNVPDALFSIDSNNNLSFASGTGLVVADGIVNTPQLWIGVPAKDTDTIKAATISTATLVAGATVWTTAAGDLSAMIVPRNITTQASFIVGTATSTFTGTLAVVGIGAKGQAVTETIAVTTNSATGVEAYSTITSATLTTTAIVSGDAANAYISIGTGDKLGLANNISAVTDVYKIIEGIDSTQENVAATSTNINTTYDTFTPTDVPDGTDGYMVWFKSISR
jgi:hypothetical protein